MIIIFVVVIIERAHTPHVDTRAAYTFTYGSANTRGRRPYGVHVHNVVDAVCVKEKKKKKK
jgi:hypothetical protein